MGSYPRTKIYFLDESYKQSLKQVLFEEELVTKSTINSFLIAQTENILAETKIREVEQFINLSSIKLKSVFKIPPINRDLFPALPLGLQKQCFFF